MIFIICILIFAIDIYRSIGKLKHDEYESPTVNKIRIVVDTVLIITALVGMFR